MSFDPRTSRTRTKPKLHAETHGWGSSDPRPVRFMPVVFDGLGLELVPGVWGDVPVHFNGVIVAWRLLAIEEGDLQIDVWKTDYASFPPTVGDTVTGSDPPLLSGADKNESTDLTSWTQKVVAGDTLRFNIDSVSGITKATLTLAIGAK